MSEFDTVIDFGSNNLRIGVFDSENPLINQLQLKNNLKT